MLDERKLERISTILSSIIALLSTLLGLLGKKKVKKGRASDDSE